MYRIVIGSALALFLLTGTALADYQPGQDVTLSLTVAPNLVKTDNNTGKASFAAQERLHNTVTRSSGQSVDHWYVWVEVNGNQVLAIDPVCVYGTR